ncbi:translation initiation factor IF-2 [Candidatus Berkelbacteria bacterium CG06_land_8_20_14_3_00_43_10]|nr:MAG: translation initiation factor IF-2 [Candidatus Berkelbacteria bacterium CG06_land_8_20_14_3_00_43_10]
MARKQPIKLSKKEAKYRIKVEQNKLDRPVATESVVKKTLKVFDVPQVVTIRGLAELVSVSTSEVIEVLFRSGVSATINESIDYETAALIAEDLGVELRQEQSQSKKEEISTDTSKHSKRPPVVTIMGHVDHGKTMLLDAIRKTNIISQESGGITQHIGAYQVSLKHDGEKREITFLDTPGHSAFSALRAHGANVTDIVILVVAANEGVKPQTIEAISHAKAAQVPIIIAINKIDLPDADQDKIKTQLSTYGLVAEDWGGSTPFVSVSAKENKNINELLDIVLLVADLQEYSADSSTDARGVVIESHISAGLGPIATVLIQQGTLRQGDIVVAGKTWGKVKKITNWLNEKIDSAPPSYPAVIAGLKAIPSFGENFEVVKNKKVVKEMLSIDEHVGVIRSASDNSHAHMFNIIIKADVVGSLEALKSSIHDVPDDDVHIEIISESIGDISESDIQLAQATKSHIYGFRIQQPTIIEKLAKANGIIVKTFDIIYKLIDDLYASIENAYIPDVVEEEIGILHILKIFFQTKENVILGGKVVSGTLEPDMKAKISHAEDDITLEGKISHIKIGPSEVTSVIKNDECGIEFVKRQPSPDTFKIKEGDVVHIMRITKKDLKLI